MKLRLKIKEVAEQKGFNQSSLMRVTGLGYNTIKRAYNQPRYNLSIETLYIFADALGVEPWELVERVDDENTPQS